MKTQLLPNGKIAILQKNGAISRLTRAHAEAAVSEARAAGIEAMVWVPSGPEVYIVVLA